MFFSAKKKKKKKKKERKKKRKKREQKQPPEVFCKKGVLKNFATFKGKHLCQSRSFLIKLRLWHRCFPVNVAKFVKAPFLQYTPGRLFPKEKLILTPSVTIM